MAVYYIGMDLHKRFSQLTEMDKEGRVYRKFKLYNHPDLLKDYFSNLPCSSSVVIEATGNWYWVCDLIEELGHTVKLAHPKKVKIIAESTVKTDKIDSEVLAHLDRTNFLPLSYIPPKHIREERELLRYRMCLVRIRSGLKNRIHNILSKVGVIHTFSDLFGRGGVNFLREIDLPGIYKDELQGYLQVIETLDNLIKSCEKEIRRSVKENKDATLLMSVPGFSYFSALLMAAEIGDISRFSSYRKLCAYGGVVSSTKQSADKIYQGHIIKDSNKYIRWVLTEAVPKAIAKDQRLKVTYFKILREKGKSKAKIAVARKMLISIYYMLKNKSQYKFFHLNARERRKTNMSGRIYSFR